MFALWRRLWGWRLSLRVYVRGRLLWTFADVVRYRIRDGKLWYLTRTANALAWNVVDLPPGADVREMWIRRGRRRAKLYGM